MDSSSQCLESLRKQIWSKQHPIITRRVLNAMLDTAKIFINKDEPTRYHARSPVDKSTDLKDYSHAAH